jgi:tripartite-type tricarboxylate transporter receptor subunit TctC
MNRTKGILALLTTIIALNFVPPAAAQTSKYPSRPVRVVLPFPPGGVVDVMGRLLAQRLSENLGQNFYIENLGGGSGNIGAAAAQRSAPDGYTIMITSSSFLVNPGFQRVPYDPLGFEAITIPSASPSVLLVHPSHPAKTVKELVDLVRKEPGQHSYASPGVASPLHLQGEMFKAAFGLDMVHVPFAGGGPALQSAVAGHTPIAIAALPPAIPLVKGGNLRALAIMGPKRTHAMPEVPTIGEAGVPGLDAETLLLVLAPRGTSKEIVDLLNRELVKIIALKHIEQRFQTFGFTPLGTTPEQSALRIKAELDMWAKVIREAKIVVSP